MIGAAIHALATVTFTSTTSSPCGHQLLAFGAMRFMSELLWARARTLAGRRYQPVAQQKWALPRFDFPSSPETHRLVAFPDTLGWLERRGCRHRRRGLDPARFTWHVSAGTLLVLALVPLTAWCCGVRASPAVALLGQSPERPSLGVKVRPCATRL